jgi:hypothetical protein
MSILVDLLGTDDQSPESPDFKAPGLGRPGYCGLCGSRLSEVPAPSDRRRLDPLIGYRAWPSDRSFSAASACLRCHAFAGWVVDVAPAAAPVRYPARIYS